MSLRNICYLFLERAKGPRALFRLTLLALRLIAVLSEEVKAGKSEEKWLVSKFIFFGKSSEPSLKTKVNLGLLRGTLEGISPDRGPDESEGNIRTTNGYLWHIIEMGRLFVLNNCHPFALAGQSTA